MSNSSRGSTLVELAIVAPVFLIILGWFWDIMVEIVALQRMHAAALIWVVDYAEPNILLVNDITGVTATGTSQLTPLTASEANDMLDRLIFGVEYLLENSGTGAAQSTISVAAESRYYEIYNTESAAPVGMPVGYTLTEGYAVRAVRRGNSLRRTSNSCWGTTNAQINAKLAEFTAYMAAAGTKILFSDPATTPPFGTMSREEFWDGTVVSATPVKEYVSYKGVTFLAICVNPPRFFTDDPIVSFYPIFAPKEARF